MKVLVIDAQGGGLGRQLIQSIREKHKDLDITCVGTNSLATNAMLKAGANRAATGENAIIVNTQRADIIIGPIGILLTNSMYGEITSKMAEAISVSRAKRILIPFLHDDNVIVGVNDYSMKKLISLALKELEKNI
ncbi:DUF3842 family protein [uncultured Anaerococcus sp.]|uniref:DUF3842 family protein n=1 Tax=uncultured Anaerococcus sp. TaxID=293428 RepID=UPI0025EFE4B7|nr:DUF3842 family protein [uncultured Anaerococcus sp.]